MILNNLIIVGGYICCMVITYRSATPYIHELASLSYIEVFNMPINLINQDILNTETTNSISTKRKLT